MLHLFELVGLITLVILMLAISLRVISFTKRIGKGSMTKANLKKITLCNYILTCSAITLIVGLYWNYNRYKKVEKTNRSIVQKFDDTLYSLSKQLIAHNLSYDKETNTVKLMDVETSGLEPIFRWQLNTMGNKSLLTGTLFLLNKSDYPLVNVKGKFFSFRMEGDQVNSAFKSFDLFSSIGLAPGSIYPGMPMTFSSYIDSTSKFFYIKVEYEDMDGFLRNPIRLIYELPNTSEEAKPSQILNGDSFDLVKTYLKKNNIW